MAVAVRFSDPDKQGVAVSLSLDEAQVVYDILFTGVVSGILTSLRLALEHAGVRCEYTVTVPNWAIVRSDKYPESLKE